MLKPMLKEQAIGCAVINHGRNNVATAFCGNYVCAFEFLTAYRTDDLCAFWGIGIFTVYKAVYAAFVDVIKAVFWQGLYEILENLSPFFAAFNIALSFFYA